MLEYEIWQVRILPGKTGADTALLQAGAPTGQRPQGSERITEFKAATPHDANEWFYIFLGIPEYTPGNRNGRDFLPDYDLGGESGETTGGP